MPDCNQCGETLEWGQEYQLDTGDDHDCLCRECHFDGL